MQYEHIARLVFGTPWAILPENYAIIAGIVSTRLRGEKLSAEDIEARLEAAPVRRGAARSGNIQVLPLYGPISQRMNMMTNMSGGTSTQLFGRAFTEAVNDPEVGAIVIDVDSPGGTVTGVPELWQTIMDARGTKPIVAVANSTMASAAYWIASAADEIAVTPSGEVGSIGIFVEYRDVSAALEQEGIATELVYAGKKKVQYAGLGPMSDEARADLQGQVDAAYDRFVRAVARGRGVNVAKVRGGYGEGGTLNAEQALNEGMVNRIATLEQTIERLQGNHARRRGQSADAWLSYSDQALGGIPAPAETELETRRRRLALRR